MSKEIDQKIVSMQLDNSNFEQNAKESLSTLDKLKEKLKFDNTSDGLDKMAASVEKANPAFSAMGNAVDAVKVKLSSLEVVGITALSRITNAAIDAGTKLVKSLSIDQVSAGWEKYSQKSQSVQSIMAATGESIEHTEEILEKLNWYSDETSYSFTNMATTLGTFVNKNGDLEASATAVLGLANALGLAGVSASGANRAFTQMSQAVARPLMTQDWSSMETLAADSQKLKQTFIETAAALGTLTKVGDKYYTLDKKLEVSSANFRDTLAADWATAEVQLAVYKKFGEYSDAIYEISDAYDTAAEAMAAFDASGKAAGMEMSALAFKNNQVARTYADTIEATKDAVSSSFMKIFQTIFGNVTEASKLWTEMSIDLWDTFAAPLERINGVLKKTFDSPVEQFNQKLKEAGVDAEALEKALKKVGKDAGVDVDELIKKYGSLDEVLKSGELDVLAGAGGNTNLLTLALKELANTADTAKKTTGEATKSLEDYKKVISEIIEGKYGNGQARIEALTKAGWDYNTVQKAINVAWDGSKLSLDKLNASMFELSDAELEAKGYTKEQIQALRELAKEAETAGSDINKLIDSLTKPSGRELLAKSIINIIEAVNSWRDVVVDAFADVFGEGLADKIYSGIESFEKFTEKLILSEEKAEKLKNTLTKVFGVVKTVSDAILHPIKTTIDWTEKLSSKFNDLSKSLKSEKWSGYFKSVSTAFGSFSKSLSSIPSKFEKARTEIQNLAKSIKKYNSFEELKTGLNGFVGQFPSLEKGLARFRSIGSKVQEIFTQIKNFFVSLYHSDFVQGAIQAIGSAFDNLLSKGQEVASFLGGKLSSSFESISTYLRKAFSKDGGGFSKIFDDIKNAIKSFSLKDAFSKWVSDVKQVKDNFIDALKPVGEFVEKIAAKIKENLDDIGLGNLLPVIGAIAALLTGKSISNIAEGLGGLFDKLGKDGIPKVVGVLSKLRDTLVSYQRQLNAAALKELAEAVALLAGSMWIISKIPQQDYGRSLGTVAGLIAGLLALQTLLGWINKKLPLGSTGFGAKLDKNGLSASGSTSIVANMWLLSRVVINVIRAFKMMIDAGIQDLPWSQIGKLFAVMGGVIAELGLFLVALGQLSDMSFGKGVGTLVFALAIDKVLGILNKIAGFDPNKVYNNIDSFITVFSLMAVMFLETRLAGDNAMAAAGALVILDVAIGGLGQVIQSLAKISWDTFKDGALKVLAIEGMLALWEIVQTLVGFLRKLLDVSGALSGGGKLMAGTAVAIFAIAEALKILGRLKPKELDQGLSALVKVFLGLGGLLTVAHDTGKAWSAILALAGFLVVLTLAISTLTALKDKQIERMKVIADRISEVFLALSVAMYSAGNMKDVKKDGIILMMLTLAEVAIILGGLSTYVKDTEKLKTVANAISEVIVALAGAFYLLAKAVSDRSGFALTGLTKSIAPMLLTLTGVAAIIGVLLTVGSRFTGNAEGVKALANGIAEIIAAIAAAFFVLSKSGRIEHIGSTAGLLGALTGMTAIISAILAFMSDIPSDINKVETMANSISKIIAVLGIIGTLMSAVSNPKGVIGDVMSVVPGYAAAKFKSMLSIIGAMEVFLVAAVVDIEIIGALTNNVEWFRKNLEGFGTFMDLLGGAFGKFTSGFTDEIGDSMSSFGRQFSGLGIYLSDFMANAKGFFDGLASIPNGADAKVTTFIDTLKAIGWAEIKDAIAQFIVAMAPGDETGGLDDFANDLYTFSWALVLISNHMGDVDSKKLTDFTTAVTELTNISPDVKNVKLEDFGNELEKFASGLVAFYNLTKEIDDTAKLSKIALIFNSLSDSTSQLVPYLKEMRNNNFDDPLTEYADDLQEFVKKLKTLEESASGLDTSDTGSIRKVSDALKMLVDATKDIPETGGFVHFFTADSDPETFGSQLEKLASGLAAMSDTAAKINISNIGKVQSAIGMLNAISWPSSGGASATISNIFNTDKYADIFEGAATNNPKKVYDTIEAAAASTSDMTTYAGFLSKLAESFNALNPVAEAIDIDNIKKVSEAVGEIGSVFTDEDAGIADLFTNADFDVTEIQDFSASISALASAMYDAGYYGQSIDEDSVGKVANGLAKFAVLTEDDVSKLTNTAALFANENFDKFKSNLDDIGKKIKSVSESGKDVVADNVSKVATGFAAFGTALGDTSINWTSAFATTADSNISSFLSKLSGIGDKIESVSKKGENVDSDAVTKVTDGISQFVDLFDPAKHNWENVDPSKFEDLKDSLKNITKGLNEFKLDKKTIDSITMVDSIISSIESLATRLSEASKNAGADVGKTILDSISSSLSSEKITEKIDNLVFSIIAGIQASGAQLSVAGDQLGAGIETGIINRAASITSAGASVAAGAVKGALTKYNDAVAAGKKLDTGIASGITQAKSSILNALIRALNEAITAGKTKAYNGGVEIGKKIIEGIVKVINDKKDNIGTTVKSVLDGQLGTSSEAYTKGSSVGKGIGNAILDGIIAGLSDASRLARIAALGAAAGSSATDAVASPGGAYTRSPSKKTTRTGLMIAEGLIVGMNSGLTKVSSTGAKLARSAISGLSETLSSVSGNDIYTPGISPVLNLNSTRRGMATLSADIAKQAHTVSANVAATTRSRVDVEFANAAAIKNLSDKIDAIATNRTAEDYLATIAENSQKQIYLNGKTLVGELTPDIDSSLGRQLTRRARYSH